MRRLPLIAIGLVLLVPAARGQEATVRVDATHALGPVNRLVLGQNVEAADPLHIFSAVHDYVPGCTAGGIWDPRARRPVAQTVQFARDIGLSALRYPGGCLTHNFNWKDAVGPLDERPHYQFGPAEFMDYCRAVHAEPVITVSAYIGGPQDAADLVEYLNAPADAAHPWAQKRAAWGHPEPYGARVFEIGNEPDHGNHDVVPKRKLTPEQYAALFNDCAQRMKAVDPDVLIGACTATTGGPEAAWNRVVLVGTRGRADFVVVHTYSVGLWGEVPAGISGDRLMRAAMAAGEQLEAMLGDYRSLIHDCTGRDLPIALTEYNAMYVQEEPIPYRFTLGGALFSADYVRVLLQPQAHIMVANYWQFCNGYWGLVRGPSDPAPPEGPARPEPWRRMPAYYLFRLWAKHFGETLVDVRADGPRLDFEGAINVHPAHADGGVPAGLSAGEDLMQKATPIETTGEGLSWRRTGPGALELDLTGVTKEQYPGIALFRPAVPATYRLTFQARATGDLVGGSFGLVLADLRGWDTTHSAAAAIGLESAADWRSFSVDFGTLPDCTAMALIWRVVPGQEPLTGSIAVRNLRVEPVPGFGAYAALTASASLSADGRTLYLIVFNKHSTDAITARVSLAGFEASSARAWTVTGPSLESLNLTDEQVRETVSGAEVVGVTPAGFTKTFPARSMTALEVLRAQ